MTDEKIFSRIKKELEKKDEIREIVIKNSRPIIKESKQAIYALHRDSITEAKKHLDFAKIELNKLKGILKTNSNLTVGAYNAAVQEFVEGYSYYYFIKENRLISDTELKVGEENYLLGICDLTGELARRAVFSVVNENYNEVEKIKDFISVIYNEFLNFDLRNSELRKKSDSIKWNMKKIEEVLYDLKIREKI